MRPPMGAGSVHQANQKGSSMGLLMPMYTFGIVAFFVYTIMKVSYLDRSFSYFVQSLLFTTHFFPVCLFSQLVMRKSDNLTPYPAPQKNDDGAFRQEVFARRDNKIPNLGLYFPSKQSQIAHTNSLDLSLVLPIRSASAEWKQHDTSKCNLNDRY